MRHPLRRALPLLALLAVAGAPLAAMTLVMPADGVLADQAALVIEATVTATATAPGGAATDSTLRVERLVKGVLPGGELVLRTPGGEAPNGRRLHVWGSPQVPVGSRALLFLVPRRDGTWGALHLAAGVFHEQREVVQQRRLGVSRLALVKLDVGTRDLHARRAVRAGLRGLEAVVAVTLRCRLGIGREQGHVVEVVLGFGRCLDEAEVDPVAEVEEGRAVRPVHDDAVRELRDRRVQVVHAQRYVLQGAALAWGLGLEERQLPLASIGADERELVGPLDHVHAEMRRDEVSDAVPVGEPVCDVVEGLRSHGAANIASAVRPAGADHFLRSTARCNCCLFILERPSMPIRLASL